jgi:predicted transcriptional regulator
MPNLSVYFDDDLAERIKKIADREDRSFSYIVRELVQEAIEARQRKAKRQAEPELEAH